MRHSLAYRGFAKLQTLLMSKIMGVRPGRPLLNEDVHLWHYTQEQTRAEDDRDRGQDVRAESPQKVLIIVPFRDKWSMTERCLDGLLRQSKQGLDLMVALADNGSVEIETSRGIEQAQKSLAAKGIHSKHLRYDVPFNFSYLNNQAFKDCKDFTPSVVVLLNNDIEFLGTDSLELLVEACLLPRAGAVGCTLLYPNGLIQHLFVFVGSKIVGSHPYKGQKPHLAAKWYDAPRAVGAVTGAVMAMKARIYEEVGGFDENLPTSYQDVDLCLKFQKLGLVNWVLPKVMLVHHETQTRSTEPSWTEAEYVEKKWGDFLFNNPFVSPVWSRKSEHFVYTPKAAFRAFFAKPKS